MMAIGSGSWSNRSAQLPRSLSEVQVNEAGIVRRKPGAPLVAGDHFKVRRDGDGLGTPDAAGRSLRSMASPSVAQS
jgi:hypothetical protein